MASIIINAISMLNANDKLHKQKSNSPSVNSPARIVVRASDCEFCDELTNPITSRFGQLYVGKASTRIIDQEDGFIAMPTLGQLFKGSLLVLPVQHIETMVQVPSALLDGLLTLLNRLEAKLQVFGLPVL